MNRWALQLAVLTLLGTTGCGVGAPEPAEGTEDLSGLAELAQPLTALAGCHAGTGCPFSAGSLTVAVAAGELAVISKHPVSSAILVNGVATPLATAASVKTIAITATGAVHTVIMDFAYGTFAPGTVSRPGITVDWGTTDGQNDFKLRGHSVLPDNITAGQNSAGAVAISFNLDAYADLVFSNSRASDRYTFALGGGNDNFAADDTSARARLGAGSSAMAAAVTVYGGPGDDTFTGGLGDDFFYGDLGNDKFKAGPLAIAGTKTFSGGAGIDTADFSMRLSTDPLSFTLDGTPTTPGTVRDGDLGNGEAYDILNDVEVIKGGPGNDVFFSDSAASGAKGHAFYGGPGTDVADYTQTTRAITVTMGDKLANDGPSGLADDLRDDVETLRCPAANVACVVTGNALDNTFVVDASSAGAGVFKGGAGVDTVDLTARGVVNVRMDNVASVAPAGLVIYTDIENVKCGSGACTVTGNALANHVWGSNTGTDTIKTMGGDDTIENVMDGDSIDCGDGSDNLLPNGTLSSPAPVNCE
jgi:hypothetical protein